MRRFRSVAVSLTVMCASYAAPEARVFFVSPEGDDAHAGTEDAPFRTIQRAQTAVRALNEQAPPSEPVTVRLRDGVYELSEALVFTPEDSGTQACPVVYEAQPGETVVISGGQRIAGFEERDGLWTVPLTDVKRGTWTFNQLYVNGRRRPRARTPNSGRYFRIDSPLSDKQDQYRGFMLAEEDLAQLDGLEQAVFVVFGSWYNTIHHVSDVDRATRTVRFTNRAGRPFSWYEKNLRYYVENIPNALDEPGEWYLDRTTGVLAYIPLPGERLETATVVAPRVTQTLIQFRGEPGTDRAVEYITLRNLQVRHTDAHLPEDLYDARQAATVQDAAILADGTRNCTIENCEVANHGEHGIWFRDDCHRNAIRTCHIHDLGGGGVYIGEKWRWGNGSPGWKGYTKFEDIPHTTEHNTVDNCFVHDGGNVFSGAVGIWIGQAAHTAVTHNDIADMTYTGISVGWDWSGNQSTCHNNRIEANHIHHIGLARMNDLAGIYTLGLSPGTVLRNNLIHAVQAYQSTVGYCLGAGIYLDQSSGDLTIENNVCYDIDNAGFFLHYGPRNRVVNNVFADLHGLNRLGWGLTLTSRAGFRDTGNVAERNIVSAPTGKLAKAYQRKSKKPGAEPYSFATIDRNLYIAGMNAEPAFSTDAADMPEGVLTFSQWQEAGYDRNSRIADPGFVDADAHDYRLKPDSPALAMGIASIDTSAVGLYGDAAWTSLPDTVVRREPDPPSPFTPRTRLELAENYEDWPVGFVPANVQFTDTDKGARIEVTDTAAADGAKCLVFVDAPGLPQPYHPNRVWNRLRVPDGNVTVSFDCMNSGPEPATFLFEMRDWTTKPLQPGPTLIFTPEGRLRVGNETDLACETGRWHHVRIDLELGEDAPTTYTLTFGPKDGPAQTQTVPFASEDFRILTWIGFVAMDQDKKTRFYIDNLAIHME